MNESWKIDALCAQIGGDLWFADKDDDTNHTREAVRICARCPVRLRCLEYSQVNRIREGVWGGLTRSQRSRLRGAAVTGG